MNCLTHSNNNNPISIAVSLEMTPIMHHFPTQLMHFISLLWGTVTINDKDTEKTCAATEGCRPEGVCSLRVEANSCFLNEARGTVEANTSSATAAPLLHPFFLSFLFFFYFYFYFFCATFARVCRELQTGWSCCSWLFSFCMWLLSPRDCSAATTRGRPETAWRAAEPNSRRMQVSAGGTNQPLSAACPCVLLCVQARIDAWHLKRNDSMLLSYPHIKASSIWIKTVNCIH